MKLALVNASPRGKKSNSLKLIKWFARDLPQDIETTLIHAYKVAEQKQMISDIADCDAYLVVFPLYTDAMPGLAKAFFERMMDQKSRFSGKPILFIIHSGFPEAAQSPMVERYLRHFAKLMQMTVTGVVIIGGTESMQAAPEEAFGKRANALAALGQSFVAGKTLTDEECQLPGHRERFSKSAMRMFTVIAPLMDIFWNQQMKKNNAFDKRFDRPFQ